MGIIAGDLRVTTTELGKYGEDGYTLPFAFYVERGSWELHVPMGDPPFANCHVTLSASSDATVIQIYDFERADDGKCYNTGPGITRPDIRVAARRFLEHRAFAPEVLASVDAI